MTETESRSPLTPRLGLATASNLDAGGATEMRYVILLVAALFSPFSAFAQPLLSNPGFDRDLSGWQVAAPPAGPVVWDPTDILGNPASGSAVLSDTLPCTFIPPASRQCHSPTLSQCAAVLPGAHYSIGLSGIVPSGSSLQGSLGVYWDFFDGPACGGTRITGNATAVGAPLTWRTSVVGVVAPPASASVLLTVLAARNEENALGFVALVDNVVLEGPSPLRAAVPMPRTTLAFLSLLIGVSGFLLSRRSSA